MTKKLHRTREGEEFPIASMLDDHLTNMIAIFHKQVMAIRSTLGANTNQLEAALYGVRVISHVEAGRMIAAIIDEAAPYLVEAYLRNLEGPRLMLCEMYARTAPLPNLNLPALCLTMNVDGYEWNNG
jgi:hypothetical protein